VNEHLSLGPDGESLSRILFVRHGHVEGIDPPRFRGRADVPLTAQGRAQARAAAAFIAAHYRPSSLYSSPLQRCRDTAGEIAAACGLHGTALEALSDLDYGEWQWKTEDEVRARWPQLLELWLHQPQLVRFPKGESLQDLTARVADVLRMTLERHAQQTVVLVGHDSGIRAMLLQLLELPLSGYWGLALSPGGISEAELSASGGRLIRLNTQPR